MPTHVYQPTRNPPTWRDRILVHPLDATVATVAVAFGVIVLAALVWPEFVPSKSMDRMTWPVVALIGSFLGAGGGVALTGLFWRGANVSTGWALERLGWLLAAGGFITYAISVAWHYPGSAFSWAIPLALGLGAVLRVVSIVAIERGVRRVLADVKEGSA